MAAGNNYIFPPDIGDAGFTIAITADDTSNALVADGGLVMLGTASTSGGTQRVVDAIFIYVLTNPLNIAFGTTVVQGGLGHQIAAGDSLLLFGAASIRALRYINFTSGQNCVFYLTSFFAKY